MQNLERQDNFQNTEIAKDFIRQVLGELQADYRAMREEQHRLTTWEEDQEFTVLGVIEAYTSDIRGYAFQVLNGNVSTELQGIALKLQELKLLDIPSFTTWFFSSQSAYPQIKQYTERLDYLRLLVLEYIRLQQLNLQSVA